MTHRRILTGLAMALSLMLTPAATLHAQGLLQGGTTTNPAVVSGTVTVNGATAVGATVSGNPNVIGGRTATTQPTARADGQLNYSLMGTRGELITKDFGPRELDWSGVQAISTTTQTAVKAAAGAGLRNCLTGLQISSVSGVTVGPTLSIQDGSTALLSLAIPAGGSTTALVFPTPVCTTANTALNVTASSAPAAVVAVNAQGYVAP